jgi:hypothetical protein
VFLILVNIGVLLLVALEAILEQLCVPQPIYVRQSDPLVESSHLRSA